MGGCPAGFDSLAVAALRARFRRPVLWLASSDDRAEASRVALGFFAPKLHAVMLPAWDTLPFDRASPGADVAASRARALAGLGEADIVVASVAAFMQKAPPPEFWTGRHLALRAGADIAQEAVVAFLQAGGYCLVPEVEEPAQYAVRGSLLDFFPAGYEAPVRLDWFGDTVESIRPFDPATQRAEKKTMASLALMPAKEHILSPAVIAHFRQRYREIAGGAAGSDPMYAAVSEGLEFTGLPQWLPFLHAEPLAPVTAYLRRPLIVADHQVGEAVTAKAEQVLDHYRTRAASADYHPVPWAEMYLGADEINGWLASACVHLSPFADEGGLDLGGRAGRDFGDIRGRGEDLGAALREYARGFGRVVASCYSESSAARAAHLLPTAATTLLPLEHGFRAPDEGIALITEQDIWGERLIRSVRKPRRRADQIIADATALNAGDFVVHIDHGIGRYEGLVNIVAAGAARDFIRLTYADDAKLLIPVENLEVLSRYGSADGDTALDKIGGVSWQTRKKKTKARIMEMAAELIKTAAARAAAPAPRVALADGLAEEFASAFPYVETDDQLAAIADVMDDLASGRPMDRLVCGDVGFGKTEIAMRAAFAVAMSGAQVAVIAPTTLLVRQHYRTFTARFAGFGVRIAQLSRLVGAKETAEVKRSLKSGQVNIVVGTHALLAKDVEMSGLGLLIIDEEQHFGVRHKERLKELKAGVHVLTLSATPIPRTLQMSMVGIRQLSMITTPPVDRLAVRTFVAPYDNLMVHEALARELARGGQVFCVVPRISDMDDMLAKLRGLGLPLRIAAAHGQMAPAALEKIMLDFADRKYDLLLSTTIIESGLDMPSVNTIIVHRADRFGLAGLYQLRGRIGRGKQRGYAYLTTPPGQYLSATAQRRLAVMQSLDYLGAGFSLASHDMDIRGAGNLLGAEQSGHIQDVGFELYQHMLENAVRSLRADKARSGLDDDFSPQISLGISVMIPDTYVADTAVRMSLYRRIAASGTPEEAADLGRELADRFGALPPEAANLLQVVELKGLCRAANVGKLDAGAKGLTLSFHKGRFANPPGLLAYMAEMGGLARLSPDHRLTIAKPLTDGKRRLEESFAVLRRLQAIVADCNTM